jgi:hypothetical protein
LERKGFGDATPDRFSKLGVVHVVGAGAARGVVCGLCLEFR